MDYVICGNENEEQEIMKPENQNKTTKPTGKLVSDNQYLVLKALLGSPLHGYAIRQEIVDMTQGQSKLSLATLYDVLHRLLDDGLIKKDKDEVIDGRVRRTYRVTGLGEEAVSEKEAMMTRLLGRGQSQLGAAG